MFHNNLIGIFLRLALLVIIGYIERRLISKFWNRCKKYINTVPYILYNFVSFHTTFSLQCIIIKLRSTQKWQILIDFWMSSKTRVMWWFGKPNECTAWNIRYSTFNLFVSSVLTRQSCWRQMAIRVLNFY